MKRRLVLFLDGTTDTEAGNTNVWRLKSLCALHGSDGFEQKLFYSKGVGTVLGETLRGSVFGFGIDDVLVSAYLWLVENYEKDDEVFIFGFSRGAFSARSLAGLVSRCGLIKLGAPLSVKQLYDRYRQGNDVKTIRDLRDVTNASSLTNEERWILQWCDPIDIKFIGVWDTVSALIDIHVKALTGGDHHFLDANLRKSEQHAYHAMAIDENRQMYDANLFTIYADKNQTFTPPRDFLSAEQRWFCGSHGDVGGGNYNDLAAQIPLQWLMSKAKLQGLAFRQDVIVDPGATTAELYDSFLDKDIPDVLLRVVQQHGERYWREIAREPEPRPHTMIHTINESIDKSVFDRCRTDPTYQPKNLLDWAAKRGLKLNEIMTSVQADNPSIVAPD